MPTGVTQEAVRVGLLITTRRCDFYKFNLLETLSVAEPPPHELIEVELDLRELFDPIEVAAIREDAEDESDVWGCR